MSAAGVDTLGVTSQRVVQAVLAGREIAVDCPTSAIAASVRAHLSPWARGPVAAHAIAAGRRLGIAVRVSPPAYVLSEGPRTLAVADDPGELLEALQGWLDHEVTRLPDRTPIHAGVVVLAGRLILLPGASGTGKTTLVAALVERGAVYFSDEFALLDDDGRVHPYPRPLRLRGARALDRAREDRPATDLVPRSIDAVVALRFVPGAQLELRRVPASEAALTLLKNTPHVLQEGCSLHSRVVSAIRGALAFEGVRGEAQDAADALVRWIP